MMFKLVTARAINSAFLLFIITSDTEQFQADTLTKVTRLSLLGSQSVLQQQNKLLPRRKSMEGGYRAKKND